MCYRREVSSADRTSPEHAEVEVRWNQRYLRRTTLILVPVFLAYIVIAAFASGTFRLIRAAGAIVFGVVLFAGGAGARRIRRRPVAATLNEFGVAFDRHDSAAWEIFREVRLGRVKPRLLFVLRPLHYIAFVPQRGRRPPARHAERTTGNPNVRNELAADDRNRAPRR